MISPISIIIDNFHITSSNLYQTIIGLYKKWFYDTSDIRTMKRIIERFQTEYILADYRGWERPHPLSDKDQTKITEQPDENPGMSAWCSSRTRLQAQNGLYTAKKRRVFPSSNFHVALTEAVRIYSTLQLLPTGFLKTLAATSKQWRLYFFSRRSIILSIGIC